MNAEGFKNTLYYGDNLDIMRDELDDDIVDLIYLDPPFQSDQSYNVIFNERDGEESRAQIKAFEDTWQWGRESEREYKELVQEAPKEIADLMQAMRKFLGTNDMMAYLVMMTIRLIEMERVLKETGSIYLHCDPTASHYLKLVMDAVFGANNFLNEIAWCYREREMEMKKFNPKHDIILFYAKNKKSDYTFNVDEAKTRYSPGSIGKYQYTDSEGRGFQIRGKDGEYAGKQGLPLELEETDPEKVYRDYLDKSTGVAPRDWLAPPMGNSVCPLKSCQKEFKDNMLYFANQEEPSNYPFAPLNRFANERLGYPTQKPGKLLEHLIKISSNEGDVVLDPFCGCGTTVTVAEKLDRNWLGIDITHIAVQLMKYRLEDTFGNKVDFEIKGVPVTVKDAEQLAQQDRFQFESWAIGLIPRVKPMESQVGDRGVDGYKYFYDGPEGSEAKTMLVQVKSGKVGPSVVRDLKGTMEREQAEMGVLITLQEPTKQMEREAAEAGFYTSPVTNRDYPKIQNITIKELVEGKQVEMPRGGRDASIPKAEKHKEDNQQGLGFDK